MRTESGGILHGRKVEFNNQISGKEYGYIEEQKDTFALIHPKNEEEGKVYPLYIVFHSAGHDVYSVLKCMETVGDHDIYHTPDNSFALVPDCRENSDRDWFWGGNYPNSEHDPGRDGILLQPVENRINDLIENTLDKYPIDKEKVYAVGNSMGGSGSMGICMRRGDIIALIKANVPAGVMHVSERLCLNKELPEGFNIPDPPVLIDYSSQSDMWSEGHEMLYEGCKNRKYSLIGYFGPFGHENNNENLYKYNDLIGSLDIESIRLHEAYPVFLNASTDDPIPWPDNRDSKESGQVNGYFRWKNISDSEKLFEIELRLLRQEEYESRFVFPKESRCDVLFRRIQNFKVAPGDKLSVSYMGEEKVSIVGDDGLILLRNIIITDKGSVMRIFKR